jgi:NAD(P)H-nitrite reductase large subunit
MELKTMKPLAQFDCCAIDPAVDSANQTIESSAKASTDPAPVLKDGDRGVILQRDRRTYAVVPHVPCGVVTSDQLRRIAAVADQFGCQALKITNAQRIALVGLRQDQVDAVWAALDLPTGHAVGDCVRSVKACPGTTFCKRGQRDSLAVGQTLDRLQHGRKLPAKFKIGVSGCPNQCSETAIKDLGLVGSRNGWDVWVGGSGGVAPRLAVRLARQLDDDTAIATVGRILDYYEHEAKPKERFFKFIARIGLDQLARVLGLPAPEQPQPA